MVMRQMDEEHELLKTHISQLSDLLKELMEDAQDLQLKELELRQEKYDYDNETGLLVTAESWNSVRMLTVSL